MEGVEVQLREKTAATQHLPDGLAPVSFSFPLALFDWILDFRLSGAKLHTTLAVHVIPYRWLHCFLIPLAENTKRRRKRKSLNFSEVYGNY